MYYPSLTDTGVSRLMTDTFYGYNHNLKTASGEWYDMENISGDAYPLMSQRDKIGKVAELSSPQGLLGKGALAYVDGGTLYYNGAAVPELTLSTLPSMCPKTLVSMGAYIVIFPDKLYYNTEDSEDWGALEEYNRSEKGVSLSLCKADGGLWENVTVSVAAPAEPQDGQAWLDTSESTHVLKQYSSTMGMWVQVSSTYVKIAATDIGRGFKEGDGVEILGLSYIGDEGVKRQVEALNGSQIVYGAGEGCVIIAGILDQAVTVSGPVKIRRTVPDMDFVIESQNRLWGCKYGPVSDRDVLGNITDTYTVNELYCCKLGDFKNWRVYSGIATDAWSASLGSDGVFTGAAVYQGYPIFFKEDCLHKVYISPTGAHQVVTTQCRGVQRGSAKSLAVVNELLYYKSPTDVCSYDGTVPVSVSAALGDERYSGAVSGSARGKYFISMDDEEGESRFFCYDTRKGLWYRWGSVGAKAFARAGDELYFYDGDNVLRSVFGTVGTPETSVSWSAETGLIGYEYPDKKYLSRYNFRMGLPKGSEMKLYVMYDSSGSWIPAGSLSGTGTGTFTLPVRPRRCDHMRFKLTGTGEIKLYSITRILEQGSDV